MNPTTACIHKLIRKPLPSAAGRARWLRSRREIPRRAERR